MSNENFVLARGSGNVFRDLGEPDADIEQAKALLIVFLDTLRMSKKVL